MRELDRVLEAARAWAASDTAIRAVALVGSHARNAARPESDVDLVVLAESPDRLLASSDWFVRFALDGPPTLVRTEDFGAIQERRLRLPSGLEIEVGIGAPSWASVAPVDPGTARVARDGLRPIWDPDGLLARLAAALER